MNINPEAGNKKGDSTESGFQQLTSLGDFNPDAAMSERKKAEAEKTREHFAESLIAASEKIDRMNELYDSGETDQANALGKELANILNAADKDNETVKDEHFSGLNSIGQKLTIPVTKTDKK